MDGVRFPCPAGTYSTAYGLASPCTAVCPSGALQLQFAERFAAFRLGVLVLRSCLAVTSWPVGYYCPTGTAKLEPSNSCSTPLTYCPLGSANYSLTDEGYYANVQAGGLAYNQTLCEPGRYCVDGVAFPCAAGRYGDGAGVTSATCSGVCQPGYYCPAGSISPAQQTCGAATVYCPEVRERDHGCGCQCA